jgi:hypothetical protein
MSPDEWTALGTMITAVVAVAAAAFAYRQVRELRLTRKEQTRPFVVVDVQPSRVWANALNLVVENVGATVARNVTFEFQPALKSTQDGSGYDIGESALVQEGIPMLPPGRRIETLLDISQERLSSDLPLRYDVTVQLYDFQGKPQEPQSYVLDLGYLYGLTGFTEYGVHHIAKSLREIEKRVKKWSDIHGRLRVWVRDEDRHRAAELGEEALTGRRPSLGTKPPPELLVALARNSLVRSIIRLVRKPWERFSEQRRTG